MESTEPTKGVWTKGRLFGIGMVVVALTVLGLEAGYSQFCYLKNLRVFNCGVPGHPRPPQAGAWFWDVYGDVRYGLLPPPSNDAGRVIDRWLDGHAPYRSTESMSASQRAYVSTPPSMQAPNEAGH